MKKHLLAAALTVLVASSAAADVKKCAELFAQIIEKPRLDLGQTNQRQTAYRLAVVEPGSDQTYRVDVGGGGTLESSVMSEILTFVSAQRGGRVVYFDVTALPANKREAFKRTAEVARTANEKAMLVRYVHELDALFDPAAKRTDLTVADSGTFTRGERAGATYSRLNATVDSVSYGLTVWSRLATAVQKFVERFSAFFRQRQSSESVVQAIVRIRREIAIEQGVSEEELQVQIRKEMGATQFVELGAAQ